MTYTFVQSSQIGLFSLPEEVIYRCIFPLLSHHELLRLRHICKSIKIFADEFIRNNFNYYFREINETNYTFRHFIKANISTTSVYLNNSSCKIFEDPHISKFLRRYGNQITHLKVNHFETCISDPELQFYSNLPSLVYLELKFIDATQRKCRIRYKNANHLIVSIGSTPFPATFKNLKTLKLNQVQGSENNDFSYAWDFIAFCDKLEYLKHPLFKDMIDGISDHFQSPFGCVLNYIMRRHINFPNLPNLKFYDLQHHQVADEDYSYPFCQLLELCDKHKVKLLNVDSSILDAVYSYFKTTPQKFGVPLQSLRNVDGHMFYTELPNLKKLVIQSVAESSFTEAWTWTSWREFEIPIPKWPNLESLDLKIDSERMLGSFEFRSKRTKYILYFLFGSHVKREKLRELALRFTRGTERRGLELPVPRVQDVIETCPFVTKLTLTNWLGSNESISKFWLGMTLLEEVTLESCVKIGDLAFVGNNWDDPVFLKLKNLKKLTLKNLHMMPKLTDQVFKSVFRHLKIKEFCITSNQSLKSITLEGIESLVKGTFNDYVERFSFDGWSLVGVTRDDFAELGIKFRAAYMM